jgi:hypothetical protein
MADNSYEQLDDLFKEIRLGLVLVRKSDPATADRLKALVRQLELWVESLVVDSLKLKSLDSRLQKTAELAKKLRERLDKE